MVFLLQLLILYIGCREIVISFVWRHVKAVLDMELDKNISKTFGLKEYAAKNQDPTSVVNFICTLLF